MWDDPLSCPKCGNPASPSFLFNCSTCVAGLTKEENEHHTRLLAVFEKIAYRYTVVCLPETIKHALEGWKAEQMRFLFEERQRTRQMRFGDGAALPPVDKSALHVSFEAAKLVCEQFRPSPPPFASSVWWTFLGILHRMKMPRDVRMLLYQAYVRIQFGDFLHHAKLSALVERPGGVWPVYKCIIDVNPPRSRCIDKKCFFWSSEAAEFSKLLMEKSLMYHFIVHHGCSFEEFVSKAPGCKHLETRTTEHVGALTHVASEVLKLTHCRNCGTQTAFENDWQ